MRTGAGHPDWAQHTAHQGDGHRRGHAGKAQEQALYREIQATETRETLLSRGCTSGAAAQITTQLLLYRGFISEYKILFLFCQVSSSMA